MPRLKYFLLFVALAATHAHAADFPNTLNGKVISVADGDTLTILTAEKSKERIRLEGIDAPETKQAYSAKSKAALSKAAKGKQVRVRWKSRDKYGRILGHIYVDDEWLNLNQIEDGFAWHYKKYSKDKKLAAAETEARKESRGLWTERDPMPPWEFRKLQKRKRAGTELTYWLNTKSNVRHNSGCRWHGKTKGGRACKKSEGKACGICGG